MRHIVMIHEICGDVGGAERIVLHLAKELQQEFTFSLIYHEKRNDQKEWEEAFQRSYKIDFNKSSKDIEQQVLAVLQNEKPNLVLLHKCSSIPLLEAILSSKLPALRWVHDHDVYCMRGYKYFPWSRKICTKKAGACCLFPCLAFLKRERKSLLGIRYESFMNKMKLIRLDQQLSGFLVGSSFMQAELQRQGYNKEKIEICHYVPKTPFCDLKRDFSCQHILFIGQIVRGKGLDVLLESLPLISCPFKLFVIGSGSHEGKCRQISKQLQLERKVDFLGYLTQEEMLPYLQKASCIVVPSMWPDPFPIVGVDCIRRGIPVVGFASGGISEWLHHGKNGLLVPWNDRKGLALALEELIINRILNENFGIMAKKIAMDEFSQSEYLQKLTKRFRSI
jgi:glycosyltransferase involved in cell wall biosynthesis